MFPEVPEGSMGAARLRGAARVPTAAPLEKSKSRRPTALCQLRGSSLPLPESRASAAVTGLHRLTRAVTSLPPFLQTEQKKEEIACGLWLLQTRVATRPRFASRARRSGWNSPRCWYNKHVAS